MPTAANTPVVASLERRVAALESVLEDVMRSKEALAGRLAALEEDGGGDFIASPAAFPAQSFLLSPAPSGGDDTAAVQAWLNQLTPVVRKGVLQAGTFKISAALKLKAGMEITGINRRYTVIEATGNAFIWEPLEGDNSISNMTFKATTKQEAGGVVDFSKGFSENFWLRSCTVGNNFFNCFNCVPAAKAQISGLSFEDLLFQENGGPVEGYAGPVWKIGNGAKNEELKEGHVVWLKLVKCYCFSSNTAGKRVPLWLDLRNCDSIDIYDCGFQYAEKGLRIGLEDESIYKSQTIKVHQTWFDHIAGNAIEAENTKDCKFNMTCIQGGGEGLVIGKEIFGLSFQGGTVQSQNGNGIHIQAFSSIYAVSILGNLITDNNQAGAAEAAKIAGIKMEAGAGNVQIRNNEIGGFLFTGKQQFGVVVLKGAGNFYAIVDNRIPEKGKSPPENTIKAIVDEGEGANKEVASNIVG